MPRIKEDQTYLLSNNAQVSSTYPQFTELMSFANNQLPSRVADDISGKELCFFIDVKAVHDNQRMVRCEVGFAVQDSPNAVLRLPKIVEMGINPGDWVEFKGVYSAQNPVRQKTAEEKKKVSMNSVVIDKDKLDEIKAAISQKKNAEIIFQEWGFDEIFEKGTAISLLFYGIPGTGKTLMAQAIADDLEMKLKIVGTAEIETSEPGGAERNIQKVFEESNKSGKTIILFDECDSLLADRNVVGTIMAAQINTLLTEIEKFEGVVVFTTNRLGKLDPALERRITAKIEFPFPNQKARYKIWKRMIPKKAPLAKDVKYDELSEFPLTGGAIKNAVLNAARMAVYKNQKNITRKNFHDAIEKEVISQQEWTSAQQNSRRQVGAYAPSPKEFARSFGKLEIKKVQN